AGQAREKLNIGCGETPLLRIQKLNYADNMAGMVPDGETQQGLGTVIEFLVKAGIEIVEAVGIFDVNDLASLGHASGNALAQRDIGRASCRERGEIGVGGVA